MQKKIVSEFDVNALTLIRDNVEKFMKNVAATYADKGCEGKLLLDIAPQDHRGARPFFDKSISVETLDIDSSSGATHIADLCKCADQIGHGKFDYIVCTEVLEHTRQPFDACENIYNMLKSGGYVFATTPYNFRIHGPLPDCWRFTEHGLRELFKKFVIVELNSFETNDRFLMPIHYTLVARKH